MPELTFSWKSLRLAWLIDQKPRRYAIPPHSCLLPTPSCSWPFPPPFPVLQCKSYLCQIHPDPRAHSPHHTAHLTPNSVCRAHEEQPFFRSNLLLRSQVVFSAFDHGRTAVRSLPWSISISGYGSRAQAHATFSALYLPFTMTKRYPNMV